jgi:hypothetical protein
MKALAFIVVPLSAVAAAIGVSLAYADMTTTLTLLIGLGAIAVATLIAITVFSRFKTARPHTAEYEGKRHPVAAG